MRTYASGAAPADEGDSANLIDIGEGGTRSILTPSAIPTFGVEADSPVNGAASDYFLTWYSEIAARDGDVIVVPFPAETSFAPTNGKLTCTAVIDSLEEVSCSFESDVVDKQSKYTKDG